MSFPIVKVFIVRCSTGCSCCSNENHKRGPFSTQAVAEGKVVEYRAIPVLASQYAERGVYHIESFDAEQLPDGRLIVEDSVFKGFADLNPGQEEVCG
jgi:hypothetical protein